MQQLPALLSAQPVPVRSELAAPADKRVRAAAPDVHDLSRSRRLLRDLPPSAPGARRQAAPHVEAEEAGSGGRGPARGPGPREPAAAGFFAQLIGQLPPSLAPPPAVGRHSAADRASSAYRQAGAAPPLAARTAQRLDLAV